MSFVIRCDGSAKIGLGHVVRSCSLADALRVKNIKVIFVMKKLSESATRFIEAAGFPVILLDEAASTETLSKSDMQLTLETATRNKAQGIIVDHYDASAQNLNTLKNNGFRLAIIDDVADRNLSAADLILNQNLRAPSLNYVTAAHCTKLLGPRYALLRPDFSHRREQFKRTFSKHDHRTLITLGGGETAPLCLQVLQSLETVLQQLHIRCIIGGTAEISPELLSQAQASRHQVQVLQNITDMAEQMMWADLSINAGGSTCWELCCLGVPMIVFSTSHDQDSNAHALAAEGCGLRFELETLHQQPDCLGERVADLLGTPEQRQLFSQHAQTLVDGRGAWRVADVLKDWTN